MSATVAMYNPCEACGTGGADLRLVEDVDGTVGDWYEAGAVYLTCPKCGRLTKPENWNAFNSGKEAV